MPGQHGAGQIIEAAVTAAASISLPIRLGVIAAVPRDGRAVALRAADAVWPTVLTHQGVALGIIDKGREVDEEP